MHHGVCMKKTLIEVALPLEAINIASAREKSIRHGHPSTLHLWWARRPLAAARAVIFAQMVDDPSAYVDVLRADPKLHRKAETALKARLKLWEEARTLAEKAKGSGLPVPEPGPAPTLDDMLADQERQRLFRIIEDLVLWENTTNETVLQAARDEIWQSWRRTCIDNVNHPQVRELFDRKKLPAFHDPFAGGGALPLEAQRLGLESYASDLNPVAVLINKAMIEIPPKFAGKPPVNPRWRKEKSLIAREWKGAQGLAEDVRYYGQWMRDEAEKRIGHLYPKVEVTAEMARTRPDLKPYVGQKLTVIAWLWARTVKSPNPAFAQVDVPLASTFMLFNKAGKEAYVEPVIEDGGYRFSVKMGNPRNADAAKNGTKSGSSGKSFLCLMSGTPMPFEYLRSEAKAGRLGARLMAIVAEGDRGRVYLSPTPEMEVSALSAQPQDVPETALPEKALGFRIQEYGMTRWRDLFTPRQLVALTTFSDLVHEVRECVKHDAIVAGLLDDGKPLAADGTNVTAYAGAVAVYLTFNVDKFSDLNNNLVTWSLTADVPYTYSHAMPFRWYGTILRRTRLVNRRVRGIASFGS
jgi:putative DNA methylase